jgi:Flp pilus assembly protein TadG
VRDDRGSAPVELMVLAFITFWFVGAIVYAGRMSNAVSQTHSAAQLAARTISMSRNLSEGIAQARADAESTVGAGGPFCEGFEFRPVINDTDPDLVKVTVTITCQVDLSEASVIAPVPGSQPITTSATEVFDRYREDAR